MCINLLNLVVTLFVEICSWQDSTHMVSFITLVERPVRLQ